MPAQSKQQQKLFGLALSVKRGDTPRSEVSDDVLGIVDKMSEKEIEDFASTDHKGLPTKKEEIEQIIRERIKEMLNTIIKEGRAFIQAAKKAQQEGKTEFEFNGKTYPITLKEEVITEMTDKEFVGDQLVNGVGDGILSRSEFIKIISKQTNFDKNKLGKVYDVYLKLDGRQRVKLDMTRNMDRFLDKLGITESIKENGDTMTEKEIEDFAGTEHEGLPKKVEQKIREMARQTIREQMMGEAKFNRGDMVRVIDNPKYVMDKKKFAGKSGYVKNIMGRDVMVKFPNGRTILVDPKDLEMNPNESVNEGMVKIEVDLFKNYNQRRPDKTVPMKIDDKTTLSKLLNHTTFKAMKQKYDYIELHYGDKFLGSAMDGRDNWQFKKGRGLQDTSFRESVNENTVVSDIRKKLGSPPKGTDVRDINGQIYVYFHSKDSKSKKYAERVKELLRKDYRKTTALTDLDKKNESTNEAKKLKKVKTDKYGNHLEPQFKKGDKVTYLGNKGVITGVNKESSGVYSYNVDYYKGNGRTKASNIFNKGGELNFESVNEANGEFVTFIEKDNGRKKLLRTSKSQRAANMFMRKHMDSILNKSGIRSIGTMSKDQWEKKEAMYAENIKKSDMKTVSKKEWDRTHKDFKGMIKGQPYMMWFDKQTQSTVYGPVHIKEVRQLKDPKKEMMVAKKGKVKVIDKKDWNKYKGKGYVVAENKQAEELWSQTIDMLDKNLSKGYDPSKIRNVNLISGTLQKLFKGLPQRNAMDMATTYNDYRAGQKDKKQTVKNWVRILKKHQIKEASLSVIHKAAKKGSYPVTVMAIDTKKRKVVKQELVKTPMAVPAAFMMMQGGYPEASISVEDAKGQIIFKEKPLK